MAKKYDFYVAFKVTNSELPRSEFIDYLIEVFQIGRQKLDQEDIKPFFWDLPSKYNKKTDEVENE